MKKDHNNFLLLLLGADCLFIVLHIFIIILGFLRIIDMRLIKIQDSARYSNASHMLYLGAPVTVVRGILGLAELTMTNQHAHPVSDPREIVDQLDRLEIPVNPRKQEEGAEGEA